MRARAWRPYVRRRRRCPSGMRSPPARGSRRAPSRARGRASWGLRSAKEMRLSSGDATSAVAQPTQSDGWRLPTRGASELPWPLHAATRRQRRSPTAGCSSWAAAPIPCAIPSSATRPSTTRSPIRGRMRARCPRRAPGTARRSCATAASSSQVDARTRAAVRCWRRPRSGGGWVQEARSSRPLRWPGRGTTIRPRCSRTGRCSSPAAPTRPGRPCRRRRSICPSRASGSARRPC